MVLETYKALGMMSGTSMDGVDVALIETDGREYVEAMPDGSVFFPFDDDVKKAVKAVLGKEDKTANDVRVATDLVTKAYMAALDKFYKETPYTAEDINVIGAHGQTITHRPEKGFTLQIGDAQALANYAKIPVVFDLRLHDMENGGQGAPLLPIYHRALLLDEAYDGGTAVLNLGGVGNVTFIPSDGDPSQMLAFDVGPANAYMDDLVLTKTGAPFDEGGKMAARGRVHENIIADFMMDDFFDVKPPKSLDRGDFSYLLDEVKDLSLEDGLATLAGCSIAAIGRAIDFLPERPQRIFVCGGGARNPFFMQYLRGEMGIKFRCAVDSLEVLEFDTDYIEAQGFAYMAVRSLKELAITFKGTTGVAKPVSGGKIYKPNATEKVG